MDKFTKGFLAGAGLVTGTFIAAMVIFMVFFFDKGKIRFTSSDDGSATISTEEFQEKMEEIIKTIQRYYYQPVDRDTLYEGAYDGIVASINDTYARYYNSKELEQMMNNNSGEYVGVGCTVFQAEETNEIIVASVFEDSPAQKGGLLPGDVLVAVDGRDLTEMDIDLALTYVTGTVGTEVVITVLRNEERIDLHMIRERIQQTLVYSMMLDDEVGYIDILAFHATATKQVRTAIEDLKSQGMKKLVIDLRANPGGLYTTAVEILDVMLPANQLVASVIDSQGKTEKSYTKDDDELDIPIAILINENSASASELFTQTMRDYGRATIVGIKSYGKGVYQETHLLSDGTAVKVTAGMYYSGKGVNIHGEGIVPDIEVEYDESIYDKEEATWEDDSQVKAAVDFLKNN